MNELTMYATKHAFHTTGAQCACPRAGRYGSAHRFDSGTGMTASAATRGTGFGTRYLNLFVRQLDGMLSLSPNGSGTSFDIRPPLSVLAAWKLRGRPGSARPRGWP
jgi:two-component sensor histidine kinase